VGWRSLKVGLVHEGLVWSTIGLGFGVELTLQIE
jgi:hypothetical protein